MRKDIRELASTSGTTASASVMVYLLNVASIPFAGFLYPVALIGGAAFAVQAGLVLKDTFKKKAEVSVTAESEPTKMRFYHMMNSIAKAQGEISQWKFNSLAGWVGTANTLPVVDGVMHGTPLTLSTLVGAFGLAASVTNVVISKFGMEEAKQNLAALESKLIEMDKGVDVALQQVPALQP